MPACSACPLRTSGCCWRTTPTAAPCVPSSPSTSRPGPGSPGPRAPDYVDVELNGESLGLYTLTEQVEQGANRVDLPDDGYLLEIDKRFRRNGEIGFRTKHGVPISFKDPDELTAGQRREVRAAARRLETTLFSRDFAHRRKGYRPLVDVGSFVDWYLVEEFFRNQDSNFQTSVNLTWTPGGRFAMGPVWDFDLSAGTKWRGTTTPRGWLTRTGRHWLTRMLEDPAFSARVKRRWATLRPRSRRSSPRSRRRRTRSAPPRLDDWSQWHDGDEPDPRERPRGHLRRGGHVPAVVG